MTSEPRQLQWRQELELLSRTGVGLPAMAPALAALIRQMVGAQNCLITWVDADGHPVGVYNEHPVEATDALCINGYERLFSGDKEIGVSWVARQRGPACGRLLSPPSAYFRSNTYNLLIRGDHYRHMLDLRVDVGGIARAVVALCRPAGKAFNESDAVQLRSLLPVLQRVCVKVGNGLENRPSGSAIGHLLVSGDGQRIHLADENGITLLRSSRLVSQQIELLGVMQTVPRFVQELCLRLNPPAQARVQSSVEVPGGVLMCSASWMGANVAQTFLQSRQILVTLQHRQAQADQVVREICSLALSPMQSRIALYAAVGGRRDACAAAHQISGDALKKHLRKIYAASGAQEWADLQARLHTAAARGA